MPARSIDAQILQSLPLLGRGEKASLLKVIQSFLSLKNGASLVAEPPFDLDEYNREIDEAEAESERDGFISHEDMKAEFEQWKQRPTA
jgi:hypothetical protein